MEVVLNQFCKLLVISAIHKEIVTTVFKFNFNAIAVKLNIRIVNKPAYKRVNRLIKQKLNSNGVITIFTENILRFKGSDIISTLNYIAYIFYFFNCNAVFYVKTK